MRTKTLLLFVFLLTGMAFSQPFRAVKLNLKEITELLFIEKAHQVEARLGGMGYRLGVDGYYTNFNGFPEFKVVKKINSGLPCYQERMPGEARVRELKSQCIELGMRLITESRDYLLMGGKGFLFTVFGTKEILIERTL